MTENIPLNIPQAITVAEQDFMYIHRQVFEFDYTELTNRDGDVLHTYTGHLNEHGVKIAAETWAAAQRRMDFRAEPPPSSPLCTDHPTAVGEPAYIQNSDFVYLHRRHHPFTELLDEMGDSLWGWNDYLTREAMTVVDSAYRTGLQDGLRAGKLIARSDMQRTLRRLLGVES